MGLTIYCFALLTHLYDFPPFGGKSYKVKVHSSLYFPTGIKDEGLLWSRQHVKMLMMYYGLSKINMSSARRQKVLTGYCFKYVDRPFCLRTDDDYIRHDASPSSEEWNIRAMFSMFQYSFIQNSNSWCYDVIRVLPRDTQNSKWGFCLFGVGFFFGGLLAFIYKSVS